MRDAGYLSRLRREGLSWRSRQVSITGRRAALVTFCVGLEAWVLSFNVMLTANAQETSRGDHGHTIPDTWAVTSTRTPVETTACDGPEASNRARAWRGGAPPRWDRRSSGHRTGDRPSGAGVHLAGCRGARLRSPPSPWRATSAQARRGSRDRGSRAMVSQSFCGSTGSRAGCSGSNRSRLRRDPVRHPGGGLHVTDDAS